MNTQALNCIKERRSCRSFKNEQIKPEELDAVLDAAVYSPTGMGAQSPKMVVVTDKETISLMRRINAGVMGADKDPFYGAPCVIVVFADSNRSTYVEDGSLLIGSLLLAAHAVGLGSCWIHRAKETFETAEGKALMKKWGLDSNYVGIGNCILGYPDSPLPSPKPRKEDYILKV